MQIYFICSLLIIFWGWSLKKLNGTIKNEWMERERMYWNKDFFKFNKYEDLNKAGALKADAGESRSTSFVSCFVYTIEMGNGKGSIPNSIG